MHIHTHNDVDIYSDKSADAGPHPSHQWAAEKPRGSFETPTQLFGPWVFPHISMLCSHQATLCEPHNLKHSVARPLAPSATVANPTPSPVRPQSYRHPQLSRHYVWLLGLWPMTPQTSPQSAVTEGKPSELSPATMRKPQPGVLHHVPVWISLVCVA